MPRESHMKPSEARQRILEEHEKLRDSIYIFCNLVQEAAQGDSSRVPVLEKLAVGLRSELPTHLDLEVRHLVPVVFECLGERLQRISPGNTPSSACSSGACSGGYAVGRGWR